MAQRKPDIAWRECGLHELNGAVRRYVESLRENGERVEVFVSVESVLEASTKKLRGRQRPNLACFGVGRRFVRKNANGPHDMTSIRKSIVAGKKMT